MKKLIMMTAALFIFSSNASAVQAPFNISLKLYKPIQLTKISDLDFGNQVQGTAADIVIAPSDLGAAEFSATGGKNRAITKSVVEASVNLTSGSDTLLVDTFTVDGPTAFDNSGDATGLKVGATAHILAGTPDGDYVGSATFSVIYQ
jgi:hypothetical protein